MTAKVSERGQMCLPAAVRRRWGIEGGGAVAVIDDGDRLILMPAERRDAIVRAFHEFVAGDEYDALVESWGDPDLLTD